MFNTKEITTIEELFYEAKRAKVNYDTKAIRAAFDFANDLIGNDVRKSGGSMRTHFLTVAVYTVRLQLDTTSVIAALLHDTNDADINELDKRFGTDVAFIVDGLTDLKRKTKQDVGENKDDQENFRKMIFNMAEDIRVLLIRLCDKVHNIQSISALSKEEQKRFADRVLLIYGPLAEYMGLGFFKRYLEDEAFKVVDPKTYTLIAEAQKEQILSEQEAFSDLQEELDELCKKYNIQVVEYQSRVKSIYSTYVKIKKKILEPGEELTRQHILDLNDILAWRVIVTNVADCYLLLGLLHGNWKHSEDSFRDYIVAPRENGYKSLHTVIIHDGKPIEVQIRTQEMHEYNEYGPASHIAYKLQGHKNAGDKYTWTRDLTTWQGKKKLSKEDFQVKAFSESIFVFTPKGKVIQLIKGATPIDFAFRIHTDLALHYIGSKVNGKMEPMSHELQTGDIVEILVGKHPNINRGWIEFARSSTARSRIRKWARQQQVIDSQSK